MSQPAIPCPWCSQPITLNLGQSAITLESAKYVQAIAAEHEPGGLITGNTKSGDTIPFPRDPGEQLYTAQDVQAAAAEHKENRWTHTPTAATEATPAPPNKGHS